MSAMAVEEVVEGGLQERAKAEATGKDNWVLCLRVVSCIYSSRPPRQALWLSHPLFAVLPFMVLVRVSLSWCLSALLVHVELEWVVPTL